MEELWVVSSPGSANPNTFMFTRKENNLSSCWKDTKALKS